MANVKKISTATIAGKLALADLVAAQSAGRALPVMRVVGFAVKTDHGESAFGPWTCLKGDFAAWKLDSNGAPTGEVTKSATCFLPDIAMVPIETALAMSNGSAVQFAVDLGALVVPEQKRKPNGSIYEYTFTEVIKPAADDPLTALIAKVSAPALPAPEAQETPETTSPEAQETPETTSPEKKSGKGK